MPIFLFCRTDARADERHCEGESCDADSKTDVAVPCQTVGNVADERAGGYDTDIGKLCRYMIEVVTLCAC